MSYFFLAITGRPKSAKCYGNVEGHMKADYLFKVLPILKSAGLEVTTFGMYQHGPYAGLVGFLPNTCESFINHDDEA